MRLKKTKLQRVKHEIVCDCGGLMSANSVTRAMNQNTPPTLYLHRCVDCGEQQLLEFSYPRIVDEEVSL